MGMEIGALTRDNAEQAGTGGQAVVGRVRRYTGGCEAGWLGVERVEFAELGSGEMVKLILQADAARRQLDGYLATLLGRFAELEGEDAVEGLCRQFGLGRHRARQQAKTANVLSALPDTLEASKQGWISIDHARVMGESHQRAPMVPEQEIELITLAIKEDLDQFKRTAARLEDQRHADGGLSRTEQRQQRRSGKVFDGDNDMVILHAGIVPAIFATDGQPLYMGRKQRAATAAQKLALCVRDGGCIGCGMRASACDAHHIIWWDHEGLTDMPNLVLPCPKCHKKVHKHGYLVNQDSGGRHQLRPPPQQRTCSSFKIA